MINAGFRVCLPCGSTECAVGSRPWIRTQRWQNTFPALQGSPASARDEIQTRPKAAHRTPAPKYRWEKMRTQVMAGLGGDRGGTGAGRAQSLGLSDHWTWAGVSEGERGATGASRFPGEHPGRPLQGRDGTGSQLWALLGQGRRWGCLKSER